jgi:hypothetical protein
MEEFVNVYIDKEDSAEALDPSSKHDFYGKWLDRGKSLHQCLEFSC